MFWVQIKFENKITIQWLLYFILCFQAANNNISVPVSTSVKLDMNCKFNFLSFNFQRYSKIIRLESNTIPKYRKHSHSNAFFTSNFYYFVKAPFIPRQKVLVFIKLEFTIIHHHMVRKEQGWMLVKIIFLKHTLSSLSLSN